MRYGLDVFLVLRRKIGGFDSSSYRIFSFDFGFEALGDDADTSRLLLFEIISVASEVIDSSSL